MGNGNGENGGFEVARGEGGPVVEANPWMKYSSTFRAIYAEGFMEGYLGTSLGSQDQTSRRAQATRSLLLIFGEWVFGQPDEEMRALVRTTPLERVEAWMKELDRVDSWPQLVQSSGALETLDSLQRNEEYP